MTCAIYKEWETHGLERIDCHPDFFARPKCLDRHSSHFVKL